MIINMEYCDNQENMKMWWHLLFLLLVSIHPSSDCWTFISQCGNKPSSSSSQDVLWVFPQPWRCVRNVTVTHLEPVWCTEILLECLDRAWGCSFWTWAEKISGLELLLFLSMWEESLSENGFHIEGENHREIERVSVTFSKPLIKLRQKVITSLDFSVTWATITFLFIPFHLYLLEINRIMNDMGICPSFFHIMGDGDRDGIHTGWGRPLQLLGLWLPLTTKGLLAIFPVLRDELVSLNTVLRGPMLQPHILYQPLQSSLHQQTATYVYRLNKRYFCK